MYVIKLSSLNLHQNSEFFDTSEGIVVFFPNLRYSKIADFIYQLTEPILAPCRALLDKFGLGMGMVDFSPILAYMILRFVQMLVYSL